MMKNAELPAETKDNRVHSHWVGWGSSLVNRHKNKIEIVALCAVLVFVWGLLSLPVIFYPWRTTEITVSYTVKKNGVILTLLGVLVHIFKYNPPGG